MHCLANLALALLPLASAIPQYPGVVICDSTGVTEPTYDIKNTEDVTENYGDKGWVNYDGFPVNVQRVMKWPKEISIGFGAGASFDVYKAFSSGLDSGVSVAWSTTKAEGTQEPCPGSGDEVDYEDLCKCGLQYKAYRQRATGTQTSTTSCGKKVHKDFDITSPMLVDAGEGDDQSPHVEWRSCRSHKSTCKDIKKMPLCVDDL